MTRDHGTTSRQNSHLHRKPITDTAALSGLRLLFNIFVVSLHELLLLTIALDHPTDAIQVVSGNVPAYILSVINNFGIASVDIFFLISGFLLKSAFAHSPPTFSSSVRYIIFRYLRLAPAYLVIALALRAVGEPNCLTLSEAFLLNFGDSRHQCVGVGWSTQVDFVSHILLLPVLSHPRILASIVLLTPPYRLLVWLRKGKPYLPTPVLVTDYIETQKRLTDARQMLGLPSQNYSLADTDIAHRRSMVNAYYPLYFGLPGRIAAVVVGVLVYSCMQNKNAIYRTVRRFPGVSLACMTVVWGFFYSGEQSLLVSPFAQMIHHSSSRVSLALATSVVIMLTCNIEDTHSDHIISRALRGILTSRPVHFLQQFSYVVYLLHTIATPLLILLPPKFDSDRLTPGWVFVLGFKLYIITVLVGLPVWGIERLALRGRAWLRSKVYGQRQDSDRGKKDI